MVTIAYPKVHTMSLKCIAIKSMVSYHDIKVLDVDMAEISR